MAAECSTEIDMSEKKNGIWWAPKCALLSKLVLSNKKNLLVASLSCERLTMDVWLVLTVYTIHLKYDMRIIYTKRWEKEIKKKSK